MVLDFSDMNRLFRPLWTYDGDKLFKEHAEYYRDDPTTLHGLLQWNSALGISGVARAAGFNRLKRRGHKLLFGIT